MADVMLDGPRRAPASGGPAKQLVVLVHGYGANGDDLISLSDHWKAILPDAAFVSPNAPTPIPGYPNGYQWFGLSSLGPEEVARGARAAAPLMNDFLDAELERLDLDSSQLALVGFSQGTMMSLHVGLRRPKAPAGILGYSGMLADPGALKNELRVRPPIQLIHGDVDQVISVDALHAAVSVLSAEGLDVKWHISRNTPHGIAPDGLEIGGRFLVSALSG